MRLRRVPTRLQMTKRVLYDPEPPDNARGLLPVSAHFQRARRARSKLFPALAGNMPCPWSPYRSSPCSGLRLRALFPRLSPFTSIDQIRRRVKSLLAEHTQFRVSPGLTCDVQCTGRLAEIDSVCPIHTFSRCRVRCGPVMGASTNKKKYTVLYIHIYIYTGHSCIYMNVLTALAATAGTVRALAAQPQDAQRHLTLAHSQS